MTAAAWRARLRRSAANLAPLLVLLLLGAAIASQSDRFATTENLKNVVTRSVPLALIAIGQTLVIISGQIDLSVGSVMALAAVVAAKLLEAGQPLWLALAAALGCGLLCGLANGLVTIKARIPAFIATLAMMGLARGLALRISDSQTVTGATALGELVMRPFAGWLLPVWVLLLLAVAMALVLSRTVFGRQAYATGSNPEAARLSGVRVDRNIVLTFMICGLLVGLAGAVECGRNTTAQPTMGELKELDSIAAVVIGGASLTGGQGSVGGSLVGVAITATLRNGCNLLGIKPEYEKVIIGPLIVLAVLYDRFVRRRRGRPAG